MTYCGYCYANGALSLCGKCRKRSYCSKECQTSDWKAGHKHWCGVAGELGHDFEIRDTGIAGKGLGLFALREFRRNDKILAERPVMRSETEVVDNPHIHRAIMDLAPIEAVDIAIKYRINSMLCTIVNADDKHGLFVNLSRANNHCLGNSFHCYVERHDVKLLIATTDIAAGEEVTFPYTDSSFESKQTLQSVWGFECNCSCCCEDVEKTAMFSELVSLDALISQQCKNCQFAAAITSGKRIISLFDQLKEKIPSAHYARAYHDLLCLCVMSKTTMEEAKPYARLAYEAEQATYSGCADTKCGSLTTCKMYAENVETHPNFKYSMMRL